MAVSYNKYFNKEKNRIEYLLIDFDYIDGNDYLANIFFEKFGFCIQDKFDGIWFKIIHIYLDDCIYELMWHEDIGNAIYGINQSKVANDLLEERLKEVINVINKRLSAEQGKSMRLRGELR